MINHKFIYSFALLLLFPFAFVYFLYLGIKKSDFDQIKNRLGFIGQISKNNDICVHCSSLGEVNGAKELIKEIGKNNNILISTSTFSGRKRARELFPKIDVLYFPLDYKLLVSNWLSRINIKTILIYETEIWPNFYKICKKENIKLVIINARLQRNLHNKKFIKKIYLEALNNCNLVMCKSNYEKQKYLRLGLKNEKLLTVGNLKYAYNFDTKNKRNNFFGNYFLMASTHDPDEKKFLQVIKDLNEDGVSTVIAPRHIERAKAIANFFKNNGISTNFLSNNYDSVLNGSFDFRSVLIIDTFGDLQNFYSSAKYVYVGGGYSKRGVQNIIEPSLHGRPILVGPNIDNFYDEIMSLKKLNGILVIQDNKGISDQENIAQHIDKYRKLSDEDLSEIGEVARTYSLKFKDIVEKYLISLKEKKIIN